MNTILTDDELCMAMASADSYDPGNMCRAVEAAVLAKLAQRNSRPVAEVIHARVEKMTPDQLAAYESARERFKLARQEPVAEIPPELDVRRILLSVVPGDDGMGHEICATNVADVEKKLGELWSELEEWQLGIRRLPAPQQADRQRVPDGWEPATGMTALRATFFMERFKREEKLLGPNEQAAVDFVLAMLAAAPEAPAQASAVELTVESIRAAGGIVHKDGNIFFTNIEQARAALAQKGGK